MTARPLWRGPLGEIFEPKHIALLRESPGTEVEVWPAGDRTIYHAERDETGRWEVTQPAYDRPVCEYVETSDEGTSFCRLAAGDRTPTREQVAAVVEAHRPASPSQYDYFENMAPTLIDDVMALLAQPPTGEEAT